MQIPRLRQYIPITLAALWLVACEVHEAPTEAAVEAVFVTPVIEEMPAGTQPPRPLVAPTPPPETIAPSPTDPTPAPAPDHTETPHPRHTVPETYEMEAPAPALPPMPAPPAHPSRQSEAPPDGMPVLETPTDDGMHSITGQSSDPMPVLSGPLARLTRPRTSMFNGREEEEVASAWNVPNGARARRASIGNDNGLR